MTMQLIAPTINATYIPHIDSSEVSSWMDDSYFEPTADMSRFPEPDTMLICVPTPLNKNHDPDLTCVE